MDKNIFYFLLHTFIKMTSTALIFEMLFVLHLNDIGLLDSFKAFVT